MRREALFFLLSIFLFLEGFALDRASSAPFISGDTFRNFCNHIYDETTPGFNPRKVKPYDTVFVKTDHDHLRFFFEVYHNKIRCPYILVTHNSDHCIPGPFAKYLDDPKIVAWFGQNVENYSHPKLTSIPIGIANKHWSHGNPNNFLNALGYKDKVQRDVLLYMNISVSTYPSERNLVYNLFKDKSYCFSAPFKDHPSYLLDLLHSKFVLSPRGNGIDCHRTWEALLMGAFPIVRTSSLDAMYQDLPVVIVEKWEDVNEDFLKVKYSEMILRTYSWNKVYIQYWFDLINSYR